MSDDEGSVNVEMPQIWQFIHPTYDEDDDDEEEEDEEVLQPKTTAKGVRPTDYVKLSRRAPRLGQLVRFLNEIEDEEELQQLLLEKDPVTQNTLLQWVTLNGHYMLAEYLVKRANRDAFSFNPEVEDVVVFNRWEEMRGELPTAAEVAERQRQRDQEKAEREVERAQLEDPEDFDEDEDEEQEQTPEELVYDTLEEYHDQWADRGVGIVKRIGELGVFLGARLRDGTKDGLGQSLFPNGDCYTGEYKENERHGKGLYWWSYSSAMYCGDWLKNMRHGYGRMVYPDGSRYLGHWVNDKKNGQGRYTYADGSSYDGAWVKNEKHGRGRYDFTDGSSYVGSFYHNAFISGEWWLACGTVRYVGNFEKDIPDGHGVFVHRCGLRTGTFMQEGMYHDGRWVPGAIKGSMSITPHLDVIAPLQKNKRVPIEFAPECNGCSMADLIKAANYGPLVRWVHSLLPTSSDSTHGVELTHLFVSSIRYAPDDNDRVEELRVRPVLINSDGVRLDILGDEPLVLKEPTTRLLLLLRSSDADREPLVVLEKSLQCTSPDADHKQTRLPTVRVTAEGMVEGNFTEAVGPALRLRIARSTTQSLIHPMRTDPIHSNAEESVIMYSQEIHADAFVSLAGKLEAVSQHPELVSYTALPLSAVASSSTDAVTVVAATLVMARQASMLPSSTVAPQRPPTPLPPPPQPRPELQPLYEAKAARDEAEKDEEDDE